MNEPAARRPSDLPDRRLDYPAARRLDLVEVLHGVRVADPYRWLENHDAQATRAWGQAQDELARAWLDGLPGRAALGERLHELLGAGLVTVPVLRGERAFFERRAGDQQHPVLVVREGDSERVLIDPSALSDDDTVTLDAWVPSIEGTRLAYWLSDSGDEEATLRVLDVASGELLDGPIDRTRYCPLAWLPGGETYFYGRRLPPEAVPEGEASFHRRVWLRRIGTDPAADVLVFGEGRDKTEYHSLELSRDGRWLVVGAEAGTAPRNDLYIADLHAGGALRTIQQGLDAQTWGGVRHDGRLYLLTNLDAPRFRLAVADPARPEPEHWRDLVAESEDVLEGFAVARDAVVVAGTRHAVGHVRVHDRAGGACRAEVELPGLGSVLGVSAHPEGRDDVFFGYSDFSTPPRVYRCSTRPAPPEDDRGSGGARAGRDGGAPASPLPAGGPTLELDAPGRLDANEPVASQPVTDQLVAGQEVYRSKDGTEVRMFVLRRADLAPGGPRPTILYGYGGFDVALTPAYNAQLTAWVERGGVYAIANLRGGSEEGEAWHRAGMREHKQNVFDDFIAAAEHLVATGITTPGQLGIYGGSNGGLLVGAALTQRPDLFAAAVCSAPLLDMVRYERFGYGETWNDEYGRADDPVEFGWLYGYSPYHHVVAGTAYPAVLFTVFESDTRVDPMHARKLCAALQWATASPRPILLRREQRVGHGARSVNRTAELAVDILSFFAARLGLPLA